LPPPAPIPVQPLAYSLPARQGKPGIITALGVMSIVIACLSGLSSLSTGFYGFGLFMASTMSSRMSSTPMSATVSGTAATATADTSGLPPGDASIAANALTAKLSLDGAHVRELDRLLRTHGRAVFGTDEDTHLSAADVRDAVKSFTSLPSSNLVTARFVTEQGTVDIHEDRAVFNSADGNLTITTAVKDNTDSVSQSSSSTVNSQTSAGGGPGGTTLTPATVSLVVAAIQRKAAGQQLNPSQVATLRAQLAMPNQTLVTPGAAAPVLAVTQGNGNVTIQFAAGNVLVLGRQGQVVFSSSMMMVPRIRISAASATIVIGEAAASIALAILLLVAGILVFRDSGLAPRLLRIYAWLKIPMALLAGTGIAMMGYDLMNSIASSMGTAGAGAGAAGSVFIVWGTIIAFFGLAFPVAALITLRSRTAKDYFNSVR